MASFERWMTQVSMVIGRVRDAEAGRPTLLYDVEVDDAVMFAWWQQSMKPSEAARRFLDGEARPK
jgi:hypothetical protein